MSRKTINVEVLKDKVNNMILNLADHQQDAREQLQNLIENVLMESGNYGGFRYLDAKEMEDSNYGTTVGIKGVSGHNMDHSERFEGTDHTRVSYF